MNKKQKEQVNNTIDLKQFLFILGWGLILGWEIFRNFQEIFRINLVYYVILLRESGIYEFAQAAISATGIILLAYLLYIKYRKAKEDPTIFNRACMPLLLLLPEAFFPVSIISPIWFTMIVGIVLFRYFSLFQYKEGVYKFSNKYTAPIILLAAFFTFSIYAYYLQRNELLGMEFLWGDWGFTLGPLLNILDGNWFYSNYHGYNVFEIHFSPGILLLAPFVWCFNTPDAFFFVGSAILFSSGLVLYSLARRLKMSQAESLIVAFIVFMIPGITNMNLCIFYGFHEVYPVLPLVFLSFLFYEKKSYPIAIVMFLLSMSFKETVPVLWLGFGMVFMLQKKFKVAIFLIIFSLAYYLFVHELVYPWLRDGQEYWNLFRFKHLGNSTTEIALSPFTRPAAFWSSLFRPNCLLFIWLLLLPFIIIIPRNPLWSCASGIVLMFICLQSSNQLQNIMAQYQTMPLAAILLNMVYNFHNLKNDNTNNNAWPVFLLSGLGDRQKQKYFSAALFATLCICIICFLFFTQNHFSKNPPLSLKDNTDCTTVMNQFKSLIPPDVPVTVSMRTAPHLVFRNKLDFKLNADEWQDYVFFVLNDTLFEKSMNQLRNKLQKSKDYNLIMGLWSGRHYLQLYKRNAPLTKRSSLTNMSLENWSQIKGISVNTGENDVQLKIYPEPQRNRFKIYLRLVRVVKYDIQLNLKISNDQKAVIFNKMFNSGISSAADAQEGDVFISYISLPENFSEAVVAQAKITKLFL